MSFRTFSGGLPRRFRVVQQSFLQRDDLAFAEVLSEQDIQAAFDTEGVSFAQEEGDVYTPSVTLWAFLSQAVFKAEHRSCVAAVARVAVLMAALQRRVSPDTGAYCRARAKLPEVVLERLAMQLADGCEETVPSAWLWHGRHMHLVDGTTLSAPDTPANQAAWPQPTTQEEGLGFPLIRMVVLMSLATALLTGMALGPCAGKETGETALFRSLLKKLPRGDIFVADRYMCSYFMIALAREHGVDAVVRQHQQRITDFRRGQSLGKEDHLARWRRPARPEWMDVETYEQMPEFLDVRELRVHVHQPGFRTEAFVVVTTLTDHQTYSSQEIASLYHKRWLVELDIRAIKVSLGIDVLRCRSPHMVRKEIWTALLAYNLIRKSDPRGGLCRRCVAPRVEFHGGDASDRSGVDRRPALGRSGANPVDRLVPAQSGRLPSRTSTEPHRTARHQAASETPPTAHQTARCCASGQEPRRRKAATLMSVRPPHHATL